MKEENDTTPEDFPIKMSDGTATASQNIIVDNKLDRATLKHISEVRISFKNKRQIKVKFLIKKIPLKAYEPAKDSEEREILLSKLVIMNVLDYMQTVLIPDTRKLVSILETGYKK